MGNTNSVKTFSTKSGYCTYLLVLLDVELVTVSVVLYVHVLMGVIVVCRKYLELTLACLFHFKICWIF